MHQELRYECVRPSTNPAAIERELGSPIPTKEPTRHCPRVERVEPLKEIQNARIENEGYGKLACILCLMTLWSIEWKTIGEKQILLVKDAAESGRQDLSLDNSLQAASNGHVAEC